jgi:ATP-dependent phosphoenolpyruvate carboxykinase
MNPLNLIERLVMTLEEAIKNKQKIETFKDMLLTNNAKAEYKIDEVTYVMNTASQHKEEIIK